MKTSVLTVILLMLLTSIGQGQPVKYKGSETISVTFQTTPDVINKLVPAPLKAYAGDIMIISVAFHNIESAYIDNQKQMSDYKYHEMYITIPAVFNGKVGGFMPILYLDKVDPIIAGREIWGFPKFYADIDFQKNEKTVSARVSKGGKILIEIELDLGNKSDQKVEADPLMYILKYIPSVEEGSVDVKQLNSVYSSQFSYSIFQEAIGKVTINDIPNGSVEKIPVVRILSSSYSVSNFVLGFGKTEYDYLKQK